MTSTSIEAQRRSLRKAALSCRDRLSPAEQSELSHNVFANILKENSIHTAQTIFTYIHFRSEVMTNELVRYCLQHGQRVVVPLTLPAGELKIYHLQDPEKDLRPGYCSIPEPIPEKLAEIDGGEIDLIFLPGSAFDEHGGRLGYGGGYYDRYIANQAPQAKRLGLAFELQVQKELPLMPHDQRLHGLITENRILSFSKTDTPSQT